MPGVINKKVFISYARKDQEKVDKLYNQLHSKGIDAWYDKNLNLGDHWESEIRSEIRTRGYFLVCLSSAACEKIGDELNFIEKEIQIALTAQESMGNESYRIIPVKLEECTCHDDRIMRIHHSMLDLNRKKGLQQLERALLGRRRSRPPISRPIASLMLGGLVVGLLGIATLNNSMQQGEPNTGPVEVPSDSSQSISDLAPGDTSRVEVSPVNPDENPENDKSEDHTKGSDIGQPLVEIDVPPDTFITQPVEEIAVSPDTVYFTRHTMMRIVDLEFQDASGRSLEAKWLDENMYEASVITGKEDKTINVFFQNRECESKDFHHRQVFDLNKICG